MIPGFVSGWVSDPARVAACIQEREARGDHVYASTFDAANPREQLKGAWERVKASGGTGVFLRDREVVILGKHRRPALQERGTCVSRAVFRAAQTSLDVAIADNYELLKPVSLNFAPIYTLARHEIGRDRCGSGDGAIVADAAKAVSDYGIATDDLFPGLTEPQIEELAVRYAAPGVGTPQNWIAACSGHTCKTFYCDELHWIFDCIASGYSVAYANSNITGSPDSKGIAGVGSPGGHARCFVGVFLDENGETQLESSESWGRFPAGQPSASDRTMPIEDMPCITLTYAGGKKKLAPGDVGVRAKDFWAYIQANGEAWAISAPKYDLANLSEGRLFKHQTPELGAVDA